MDEKYIKKIRSIATEGDVRIISVYQRTKRILTPEEDMRPNYMKGNINLPSYISPITIK